MRCHRVAALMMVFWVTLFTGCGTSVSSQVDDPDLRHVADLNTSNEADSAAVIRFSLGLSAGWPAGDGYVHDVVGRTFSESQIASYSGAGPSVYGIADSAFVCKEDSFRGLECDSISIRPILIWSKRLVYPSREVPVTSVLYIGTCVGSPTENRALLVVSKAGDDEWESNTQYCEALLRLTGVVDSTTVDSFLSRQRTLESTFYVGDSVCSESRPARCYELDSIQADYSAITEIFGGIAERMRRYIESSPASR